MPEWPLPPGPAQTFFMTAPTAVEASPEAATCIYSLWLSRGAVDAAWALLTFADAIDVFGLVQVTPLDLRVREDGTYAVAGCRPA